MMMKKLVSTAAAVAACAVATAGCGGSDGTSAGTTTEPQTRDDALVQLAQCMRDHGIDAPDPKPGEGLDLSSLEEPQNAIDAAREECGDALVGSADGDPQALEERQDALVEFAHCMREHGVDMPDPDLSGGAASTGLEEAKEDRDYEEAEQACREAAAADAGADG